MLSQIEADALIAMPKKRAQNDHYDFPQAGEELIIPIVSIDGKEFFLLDISRGKIKMTKCSYQERYKGTIILVRLDVDGLPHTNPDVQNVPLPHLAPYNGLTLQCPHLHLYVEGFMDKWAIPAPIDKFPQTGDIYSTVDDFFRFCNIIDPPIINRSLFI